MNRLPMCILVVVGLCGSLGCANEEDASEVRLMATATGTALLPWKEGNRWTYRVTDDNEVGTKEVAVGPEETVGGTGPNRLKKANRSVTKKDTGDLTISWQAREGERVVRYREQAIKAGSSEPKSEDHWDPSKLHADESAAHTAVGASWTEEYTETSVSKSGARSTTTERDQWTVEAIDQVVTVPAGTFRAIVLQKSGGGTPKKYWYVRGIGKVKETGGQIEELVSYQLAP